MERKINEGLPNACVERVDVGSGNQWCRTRHSNGAESDPRHVTRKLWFPLASIAGVALLLPYIHGPLIIPSSEDDRVHFGARPRFVRFDALPCYEDAGMKFFGLIAFGATGAGDFRGLLFQHARPGREKGEKYTRGESSVE